MEETVTPIEFTIRENIKLGDTIKFIIDGDNKFIITTEEGSMRVMSDINRTMFCRVVDICSNGLVLKPVNKSDNFVILYADIKEVVK